MFPLPVVVDVEGLAEPEPEGETCPCRPDNRCPDRASSTLFCSTESQGHPRRPGHEGENQNVERNYRVQSELAGHKDRKRIEVDDERRVYGNEVHVEPLALRKKLSGFEIDSAVRAEFQR